MTGPYGEKIFILKLMQSLYFQLAYPLTKFKRGKFTVLAGNLKSYTG